MRRLVGTKDDMKYEGLVEFLYQHVRVLPSSKMAGNIPKSTKFRFAANTAAYSSSPSASPLSCSHNHVLRNCPVFLGMDVRLRPEFVTQKRLCWNCLDSVHQAKKWSSKFTCRTCHEKHHSLLLDPALSKSSSVVASSPSVQQPSPPTVLLATVIHNVIDDHGHEHQTLLDTPSMSTFISKPLAKLLFNPRSKVDVTVSQRRT